MISPFPLGDLVKMRIMRNKTPFLAQAQVTNTLCGMGMGLKFTIVAPEQMELLDKWTGELSGASPKYQMQSVAQTPGKDPFYVVNEIVAALMRNGILSDQEGKIMLKKLAN